MSTTLTAGRIRPTRALAAAAAVAIIGVGAVAVAQAARLPTSTTDETFTLSPGSPMLDVEVDRGQVLLTASATDRVQVRRAVEGGPTPAVEEGADAHGASLKSRCPALSVRVCSIRYEIAVPAGYVVDVAAGTARVEAHGLAVEKLQIEGSSGSIQLEDIQGSVEIQALSGSVTGTRLGLIEFVGRLGSGSTRVDFTLPPERVAVTTTSGAAMIRLPAGDGPYRVAAHTTSGKADVQVPTDPASPRHIDVSSGSGDLAVLPQ